MLFKGRNKRVTEDEMTVLKNIKMYDGIVKLVDHMNFLGIILDEKLNWKRQRLLRR